MISWKSDVNICGSHLLILYGILLDGLWLEESHCRHMTHGSTLQYVVFVVRQMLNDVTCCLVEALHVFFCCYIAARRTVATRKKFSIIVNGLNPGVSVVCVV